MKYATALLITLLAMPAWAADFTFNVPVNITRLPAAVTGLRVQCAVSPAAGPTIGGGNATIAIRPDGGYSGSVRVEVNASAGMNAADAVTYLCLILTADGADTSGNPLYGSPAGVANVLLVNGRVRP